MDNFYIGGIGGHAQVVYETCISNDIHPRAFVKIPIHNSRIDNNDHSIKSIPVIEFEDMPKDSEFSFHIALGDNVIRKTAQQFIHNKFKDKIHFPNIVHKTAYISKDVKVGVGNFFAARSFVGVGSEIGDFNIINTGANLDHHNILKDYVFVGPAVTTAGKVQIGNGTKIGIGACISENIRVGENSVIAAMSFVNKEIMDSERVFGIPSKSFI